MNRIVFSIVCFFTTTLITPAWSDNVFDISQYKGRVVYVDFWASWCAPCRASFPFMHDMAEKYADDLVIKAINVDEQRSEADIFLSRFDINFDIVYDPDGELAKTLSLKGMPTSFLYDRQGNLLSRHVGFKKADIERLEKAIAAAF